MLPNPQHPNNPEPSKTGPSHPGPSISPEPPANLADGEIGSETRGGIDVNDIPLSELPPLPDVELPLLNDPMGYGYQSWAAIVASGVFYGVIAAVITTVGIVTISTYQGLGVNGFLWSLIFGLIGCTISSVVIALLLGGVVGAFCVILFWSINLSLGKSIPRRICALCAGGLTGYMSLTAIVWANGNWDEFLVMFLMILFGPVLATILMTMLVGFFIDRYGAFYDAVGNQTVVRLRINIRHLLAATVWGAAVFAVANLAGRMEISVLAMAWIVLQVPILIAEHYCSKWRTHRREQRMQKWKRFEIESIAKGDVAGPVF